MIPQYFDTTELTVKSPMLKYAMIHSQDKMSMKLSKLSSSQIPKQKWLCIKQHTCSKKRYGQTQSL